MSKIYPFKNNPLKKVQSFFGISGLQPTLLLFVVLPLVLLSALGISFGLDQAGQFQEKRLKNDLKLIGRAISLPVGTAINNQDIEAVKVALDSVFVLGEVYGASVFDVDGNRIASAGVAEADLSDTSIPARIRTTGEGQEAFSRVAGRNLFSHFLPMFDAAGQIQGLIQITRKASDFGQALKQLTVIAWLIWGVFSLTILTAVLLGHYRGVGRYVDKLLEHMQQVAKGDLTQRLTLKGPTEVVSIAQGLNQMLVGIEQANNELEAHRLAETRLVAQIKDNEKMVAIGSMAQGIAHELGAPLSVIDGRARRLERSGKLTAVELKQLQGIRSQVDRLTLTVHQLLDYCRPNEIQPRKVYPKKLVEDALAAIAPELEVSQLYLETSLSRHLPSFMGDANRLELALLNLLRNALQAAKTRLTVGLTYQNKQIIFTLTDDGEGLAENLTSTKLLEPFFTTKSPGEGTGLGLAIVQSVAQEHYGQLTINNLPQGGCQAQLLLPINPNSKDNLDESN